MPSTPSVTFQVIDGYIRYALLGTCIDQASLLKVTMKGHE